MPNRRIISFCTNVAEKLKDENGYVPVRNILAEFQIKLEVTPLLVEAMLASRPIGGNLDRDELEWVILTDKDRFDVSFEAIASEGTESPLEPRFRNTIAHEAIHSLSFRCSESRFLLDEKPRSGESHASFVTRLERQTEALSPLLLFPYSRITDLLRIKDVDAITLSSFRRSLGVSRDVFINRLSLLRDYDPEDLRFNGHLENVLIGIGEWINGDRYVLRKWPFYANFSNGNYPHFVGFRQGSIDVDLQGLLNDPNFCLCGGNTDKYRFECRDEKPGIRWDLDISVELSAYQKRTRFLYVIRRC
jgi:hypothetical protein